VAAGLYLPMKGNNARSWRDLTSLIKADAVRAGVAVLAAATMAILGTVWLRKRRRKSLGDALDEQAQTEPSGEALLDDAAVEARLAELFEDVKLRSKGVCYIVSNKGNSTFSASNLASYLRQKKLQPCSGTTLGDVLANAELLVSLLEKKGDTCRSLASTMRHSVPRQAISPVRLQELFPSLKAAYEQQPLDYGRNSRYGSNWRISCYLVVMPNWKPKINPHQPMVDCMGAVMCECVAHFERWYCELKKLESAKASVMNAFVTRYKAIQDEDQLQKHIDGSNVDGSIILALPTDDPFVGGKLLVWDGKPQQELTYEMAPGDMMLLDNAVWHQALKITSGTRWSLVCFLRLHPGPPRPPPASET